MTPWTCCRCAVSRRSPSGAASAAASSSRVAGAQEISIIEREKAEIGERAGDARIVPEFAEDGERFLLVAAAGGHVVRHPGETTGGGERIGADDIARRGIGMRQELRRRHRALP